MRLFLIICSFLISTDMFAVSIRCNGHLLERNSKAAGVLEHCGSPVYSNSFVTTWVHNQDERKRKTYSQTDTMLFRTDHRTLVHVEVTDERITHVKKIVLEEGQCPTNFSFDHGTPIDVVGYLCGLPDRAMVIEEQLMDQGNKKRKVKTEQWQYGSDKLSFYDRKLRRGH